MFLEANHCDYIRAGMYEKFTKGERGILHEFTHELKFISVSFDQLTVGKLFANWARTKYFLLPAIKFFFGF